MTQYQSSYSIPPQDRFDPEEEKQHYTQLITQEKWQEIETRLCQDGERFLSFGYTATLQELLDAIKEHGIESPSLSLVYGELFSMTGEWEVALQSFTKAFSSSEARSQTRVDGWLK